MEDLIDCLGCLGAYFGVAVGVVLEVGDVGWSLIRVEVVVEGAADWEGVAAVLEHFAGEGLSELHCLGTEVEEHRVGAPATDQLDGSDVNVGA